MYMYITLTLSMLHCLECIKLRCDSDEQYQQAIKMIIKPCNQKCYDIARQREKKKAWEKKEETHL